MSGLRYTIFRGMLNALYFSGAHWMLKPVVGGAGAILMLHHVRPPRLDRFQPNRLLEVTPKFFERVIKRLRQSKVDLISLDEMHRRLVSGESPRRFVCITFDDGYADNFLVAAPILRRCRAAVAGQDAVTALTTEILPRPGGMSDLDYGGYLARALAV